MKTTKTVKEDWKQVDGGRTWQRNVQPVHGFPSGFLEVFRVHFFPYGLSLNPNKNEIPVCIVLLGLKDCDGFQDRR